MKKVGIITFHFANNFGAVLQAFALRSAVSDIDGVESYLIDYRNAFIRFTDTIRLFPITKSTREFISGIRTIGMRLARVNKFKRFIYKPDQCIDQNDELDIYICGSDQIWNPLMTGGGVI